MCLSDTILDPSLAPLSLPLRLPSPSPAWRRRIRPPHAAKPPPNHASLQSLQNPVLNSHRHPLTREIDVEDARLFSGESLRFRPRADEWMRSFTTLTSLAIFFCGDVEPRQSLVFRLRLSLGKKVLRTRGSSWNVDVNLIVTDDCMPGMTGAHLIIMIKLGCVNTPTFIYCNNSDVPEKQH
ncbi:hypothetical protein ACLB2K_011520 [Fragaria x ananassa]